MRLRSHFALASIIALVTIGATGGPYLKDQATAARDAWLIANVLRNDLDAPLIQGLRSDRVASPWEREMRVRARRLAWRYWHATHPPAVAPPDIVPAFPGAKGFGAPALDLARDSARADVWPVNPLFVTNTNSSGTGSFRQALVNCQNSPSAYNIVIFRTGGLVALSGEIHLTGGVDNCYVAGQTAPGGGITVTGNRLRINGNSSGLAIRHIRFASKTSFNLLIEDCEDCILDHISSRLSAKVGGANLFSFDVDSITTSSENLARLTLSNSLAAFPDLDHPTQTALDGNPHSTPPIRHVTLYRNMWLGPGHRGPSVVMGHYVNIFQSVWYNWQSRPAQVAESGEWSVWWSGNYSKTGPATPTDWRDDYAIISRNLAPNTTGGDGTVTYSLRVDSHRASQTGYDASVSADSLWRGSKRIIACQASSQPQCVTSGDTLRIDRQGPRLPLDSLLPDTVDLIPAALHPDTTPLTDALLALVDSTAGASEGVDSLGLRFYRRDAFDAARVQEFQDSTGPSALVDVDTFTVAAPAAGTACFDGDSDGMCKAWEDLHGLDDAFAADNATDNDGDGWLAIDEAIHGTDPNVFTDENGGEAVGTNTYGAPNNRRVYLASLRRITVISPDSTDTAALDVPPPESLSWASAQNQFTLVPLSATEALLVTLDTLAGAATFVLFDSAQVDSACTANGLTACPGLVRDRGPGRQEDAPEQLQQAEGLSLLLLYDEPPARSRGWSWP